MGRILDIAAPDEEWFRMSLFRIVFGDGGAGLFWVFGLGVRRPVYAAGCLHYDGSLSVSGVGKGR